MRARRCECASEHAPVKNAACRLAQARGHGRQQLLVAQGISGEGSAPCGRKHHVVLLAIVGSEEPVSRVNGEHRRGHRCDQCRRSERREQAEGDQQAAAELCSDAGHALSLLGRKPIWSNASAVLSMPCPPKTRKSFWAAWATKVSPTTSRSTKKCEFHDPVARSLPVREHEGSAGLSPLRGASCVSPARAERGRHHATVAHASQREAAAASARASASSTTATAGSGTR